MYNEKAWFLDLTPQDTPLVVGTQTNSKIWYFAAVYLKNPKTTIWLNSQLKRKRGCAYTLWTCGT